jgi:hypothetical protein
MNSSIHSVSVWIEFGYTRFVHFTTSFSPFENAYGCNQVILMKIMHFELWSNNEYSFHE